MLIITKSMSGVLRRQKYQHKVDNDEWCVRDTELNKKVFGPTTKNDCTLFISKAMSEQLPYPEQTAKMLYRLYEDTSNAWIIKEVRKDFDNWPAYKLEVKRDLLSMMYGGQI